LGRHLRSTSYDNSAPTDRILMIDPSSMPIAAGKATLTIGALQRVDGVYSGDYKIKVFPWFLKNEKGRLAIVVSDESLAEINQGKAAAMSGPPPRPRAAKAAGPGTLMPRPRRLTSIAERSSCGSPRRETGK
jgi:hypothetical protein